MPRSSYTHKSHVSPRLRISSIVFSIWEGCKSRILSKRSLSGNVTDHTKIFDFFRNERYNEKNQSIIDTATSWYFKFAIDLIIFVLKDRNAINIVDLGCGQGKVFIELTNIGVILGKYIGIDLFISEQQRNLEKHDTNVKFIQGDAGKTLSELPNNFAETSVLVAINALCYNHNIENFVNSIGNDDVVRGKWSDFVVVEPYPSIFWENFFDGIHVHLRSPRTMCEYFTRGGWELRQARKIYLFKVGDHYFWPVAYGLWFGSAG
jgi:SAM-dependent methyltransferase